MATEGNYKLSALGAESVLTSTELNSLANGSGAIATKTMSQETGSPGPEQFYATFEFLGTFASAPTAGAVLELYAAVAMDGTNLEDVTTGAAPVAPAFYLGAIPLLLTTSSQRRTSGIVALPPFDYRVYAINRSGQALPASVTLRQRRFTDAGN